MNKANTIKRALLCVLLITTCLLVAASFALSEKAHAAEDDRISSIIAGMTLDEKVSQMIIPAIRTWDDVNVTDLAVVPDLEKALRAHQYGGVILFGQNITGTEQTVRLLSALQVNNAQIDASTNIPYFTPVDDEGGIVMRLPMGTRMTGNMAIGATGANAIDNALSTGRVLGKECSALGFNVDYAPVVDVNNNPANPVIGTRSFSDDPALVGPLGASYASGLKESNVIATYKHFPGHGDTSVDSHIGTPSVEKTYDQIKATELVPFQHVIDKGADIIMTAHITYPLIDDEVVFGDGVTKGFYPATMSKKMITEVLRDDMGYDGVVVTDALEMDAIHKAKLVPGEEGSVEYSANVAEKVINAGVDILLIPTDLKNLDAADFYDSYIDALCGMVEAGTIPEDRIDQSVERILTLKDAYGILDMDTSGGGIEDAIAEAEKVVGSRTHHQQFEAAIAQQAVTLVKNDNSLLPLSGYDATLVIMGNEKDDCVAIESAINQLKEGKLVDPNAYVDNLATGVTSGSADSETRITIGYYYDAAARELDYSEEAKAAIAQADHVVCFSKMRNLANYQPSGVFYQGISAIQEDAKAADASFILLSGNLPYDASRFTDADAAVLTYMSSGTGIDPTSTSGSTGAYNANVIAGIMSMFDNVAPKGTLPVNVPVVKTAEDGSIYYSDEILYGRGFGLGYSYQFTEGMQSTYKKGSTDALSFRTNARYDKLVRVAIDGQVLDPSLYTASWGPTRIVLSQEALNSLDAGEHALEAIYDYGSGEMKVATTFAVTAEPQPAPVPEPSSDPDPQPSGSSQPSPQQTSSQVPPTPAPKAPAATAPAKTTAKTGDEAPLCSLGILALLALSGAGVASARMREH